MGIGRAPKRQTKKGKSKATNRAINGFVLPTMLLAEYFATACPDHAINTLCQANSARKYAGTRDQSYELNVRYSTGCLNRFCAVLFLTTPPPLFAFLFPLHCLLSLLISPPLHSPPRLTPTLKNVICILGLALVGNDAVIHVNHCVG